MHGNTVIINLMSIIFGLLGLLAMAQFVNLFKIKRYEDPHDRKSVLGFGDSKLCVLGGELEPGFWGLFIRDLLKSKVEHLDLIFGPRLIISQSNYEKYIRSHKINKKKPAENDVEWLSCHPVLKYFSDNPDKISLYLKTVSNAEERHFSVGDKKNVCIEDAHGKNMPAGGILSRGDWFLYHQKQAEFDRIKRNRDYCTEFTLRNAHNIFAKISFEPAIDGNEDYV